MTLKTLTEMSRDNDIPRQTLRNAIKDIQPVFFSGRSPVYDEDIVLESYRKRQRSTYPDGCCTLFESMELFGVCSSVIYRLRENINFPDPSGAFIGANWKETEYYKIDDLAEFLKKKPKRDRNAPTKSRMSFKRKTETEYKIDSYNPFLDLQRRTRTRQGTTKRGLVLQVESQW